MNAAAPSGSGPGLPPYDLRIAAHRRGGVSFGALTLAAPGLSLTAELTPAELVELGQAAYAAAATIAAASDPSAAVVPLIPRARGAVRLAPECCA